MMLICGRRCKGEDEGAVPIAVEYMDHLLYEQPICGYFNECRTAHWGGGLVRDCSKFPEWELIEPEYIVSWDGFEGNDDDKVYPELFDGEHYDIEEFTCKNQDVLEDLKANRERAYKRFAVPECFGEHYKITCEVNKCHPCTHFQRCVTASIGGDK